MHQNINSARFARYR